MRSKVVFLGILIAMIFTGIQSEDPILQQQIKIPPSANLPKSDINNDPKKSLDYLQYTEIIEEFKLPKQRYNQRLQTVVGCWLMTGQYLEGKKSDYLFNSHEEIKEQLTLLLVKQCMKKITRKQAVVKITQLVKKNMQPPKKYDDIVKDENTINAIFIRVNKEHINQESIISKDQIDSTIQQTNILSNISSQKSDRNSSFSEFDLFLLGLIKNYEQQFSVLNSDKGIKVKIEQQLKKRQKYYFGFIPASTFSHSVFLVTLSLAMMFCCTCCKYYKMRLRQQKKIKGDDQDVQTNRKLSKMSQMTMKKKRT